MHKLKHSITSIIMFIVSAICAYKSISHTIDTMTFFEIILSISCFQIALNSIAEMAKDED